MGRPYNSFIQEKYDRKEKILALWKKFIDSSIRLEQSMKLLERII